MARKSAVRCEQKTDICQNKQQAACQNAGMNVPQVLEKVGAGEGNRTLVISLEGFCSTIELHPRVKRTLRDAHTINVSKSRQRWRNSAPANAVPCRNTDSYWCAGYMSNSFRGRRSRTCCRADRSGSANTTTGVNRSRARWSRRRASASPRNYSAPRGRGSALAPRRRRAGRQRKFQSATTGVSSDHPWRCFALRRRPARRGRGAGGAENLVKAPARHFAAGGEPDAAG